MRKASETAANSWAKSMPSRAKPRQAVAIHWIGRLGDRLSLSKPCLYPCSAPTSPPSRAQSPPEAAQAQGLGEPPGAVLLAIHDGGHGVAVLHDDGHLTVPLPQHAAVVDVGRAWAGQHRAQAMSHCCSRCSCTPSITTCHPSAPWGAIHGFHR